MPAEHEEESRANGYEVSDLGRDVPAAAFIARAKEERAEVIGMSALLTTTMEEQRKVIKAIKAEGLPYKTVVGGAPENRHVKGAGHERRPQLCEPRTLDTRGSHVLYGV